MSYRQNTWTVYYVLKRMQISKQFYHVKFNHIIFLFHFLMLLLVFEKITIIYLYEMYTSIINKYSTHIFETIFKSIIYRTRK